MTALTIVIAVAALSIVLVLASISETFKKVESYLYSIMTTLEEQRDER